MARYPGELCRGLRISSSNFLKNNLKLVSRCNITNRLLIELMRFSTCQNLPMKIVFEVAWAPLWWTLAQESSSWANFQGKETVFISGAIGKPLQVNQCSSGTPYCRQDCDQSKTVDWNTYPAPVWRWRWLSHLVWGTRCWSPPWHSNIRSCVLWRRWDMWIRIIGRLQQEWPETPCSRVTCYLLATWSLAVCVQCCVYSVVCVCCLINVQTSVSPPDMFWPLDNCTLVNKHYCGLCGATTVIQWQLWKGRQRWATSKCCRGKKVE